MIAGRSDCSEIYGFQLFSALLPSIFSTVTWHFQRLEAQGRRWLIMTGVTRVFDKINYNLKTNKFLSDLPTRLNKVKQVKQHDKYQY